MFTTTMMMRRFQSSHQRPSPSSLSLCLDLLTMTKTKTTTIIFTAKWWRDRLDRDMNDHHPHPSLFFQIDQRWRSSLPPRRWQCYSVRHMNDDRRHFFLLLGWTDDDNRSHHRDDEGKTTDRSTNYRHRRFSTVSVKRRRSSATPRRW